jgi:thiol-disulfide isomerase/thioredoxin
MANEDCGCGGKSDCITLNATEFKQWMTKELKRLDCGCGCKGVKKFEEKYGQLVGGKLKDCPPGWRNDGLTCVENCKEDERDDGLTCRKKCPPDMIDDGLTCRRPITSSIDPCPEGSRDVAGTCWGPVRQDCIDDCFKHPAPGCRTYECGRLKGLFGEDWGPKLCTDCNLRCGPTCWDVMGITRQLHERNLRLSGGEVILQAIRGKRIEGRVDWAATFAELENGMKDVFGNDSGLALLFDPNKNGVNEAFRKFGEDTKGAFEEIGRKTKDAFDKMGADAKAAFEKFAKDAEGHLTGLLGQEFMDKMKDPKFWIEAAAIFAQVGATVLGVLVTAGTLGMGAAAGAALIMAANMVGPAIRMIGKAAMNEPIDALDIADMALSAIPAPGPGKAASSLIGKAFQTVIRNGSTIKSIGGLVVSGVKAGQALNLIPSSCIANCPPPDAPVEDFKPDSDPYTGTEKPPKPPPPPPGQLTDQEIIDLQPKDTKHARMDGPRGPDGLRPKNPKYIPSITWINKYRFDNYGTPYTDASGAITNPEDQKLKDLVTQTTEPPVDLPDALNLEGDEIEPFGADGIDPFADDGIDPFADDGIDPFADDGIDPFAEEGEAVVPEPELEVTPPVQTLAKPIGTPLTDEEIAELQPKDTVKRKIDGPDGTRIDNPKYIPGIRWIEEYKAKESNLPEKSELVPEEIVPFTAVEVDPFGTEEIEQFGAVEEVDPFGKETEEEIVPFGEEAEVDPFAEGEVEGEIVPFDSDEVDPFAEGLEEIEPFDAVEVEPFDELVKDAEAVAEIDPFTAEEIDPFEVDSVEIPEYKEEIKVGDQTIFPNQYNIERFGDECGRSFQEDELLGAAEPFGNEIEPFADGDVIENPFGTMRTNVQYAFIPKTHKGNLFVPECYAAKNPEVAKASNDDYDKLTSHWVEFGSKQGLDADCGPGTSTVEERIKMLEEQEKLRLQTEARKVACKAADKFWIASEERCDGFRDAEGNRNTEAEACRDNNNFWDDEFGYKFCNTKKDPSGQTKTGKEVCSSEGSFWDGSKCIRSRNVDNIPKNYDDVCTENNAFVQNTDSREAATDTSIYKEGVGMVDTWKFCDVTKDKGGNPLTPEQICKDLNSEFKDGKCDIRLFPNGQPKPQEYIPYLPWPGLGDDYFNTTKIKQWLILLDRNKGEQGEIRNAQEEKESKLRRKYRQEIVDNIIKIYNEKVKDILKLFDPVYFFKQNIYGAQTDLGLGGRNTILQKLVDEDKLSPEDKKRFESGLYDWYRFTLTTTDPGLTEDQKTILKYKWLVDYYWMNYEGTPGVKRFPNQPIGRSEPPITAEMRTFRTEQDRQGYIEYEFYHFLQRMNPSGFRDTEEGKQRNIKWMKNLEENGFETLPEEKWSYVNDLLRKYDEIGEEEKKVRLASFLGGAGKPSKLTLYWAEWCPHCHDLMPEWKKLKHKGVQIEAIEESKSKVKVDGYPTIVFRSGKTMEKYTGPRTAKAIKKFLKNKLS